MRFKILYVTILKTELLKQRLIMRNNLFQHSVLLIAVGARFVCLWGGGVPGCLPAVRAVAAADQLSTSASNLTYHPSLRKYHFHHHLHYRYDFTIAYTLLPFRQSLLISG